MRLLAVHPGATWATQDVHTGLVAGLRAGGHDVIEYALSGRLARSAQWFQYIARQDHDAGFTKPYSAADVQYHASQGLLERALRFEVDWVLVICGAYLHPDILLLARRAGLRLAAVFTESPYDDVHQARVAPLYDVCFTNERCSVAPLRAANPQTFYLPAGYDPAAHGATANGQHAGKPGHDVVFVGTAFGSRLALLSAVDWSGIDLGLYGHWALQPGDPLYPFAHDGVVDNARAGALYRHARIGLNLYREPPLCDGLPVAAESLNPRAYELAADGVLTLSTPRAEVGEKFGDAVPTFTTAGELGALVRHHLAHPNGVGQNLRALVAEDTYHHRAAQLVAYLEDWRQ